MMLSCRQSRQILREIMNLSGTAWWASPTSSRDMRTTPTLWWASRRRSPASACNCYRKTPLRAKHRLEEQIVISIVLVIVIVMIVVVRVAVHYRQLLYLSPVSALSLSLQTVFLLFQYIGKLGALIYLYHSQPPVSPTTVFLSKSTYHRLLFFLSP